MACSIFDHKGFPTNLNSVIPAPLSRKPSGFLFPLQEGAGHQPRIPPHSKISIQVSLEKEMPSLMAIPKHCLLRSVVSSFSSSTLDIDILCSSFYPALPVYSQPDYFSHATLGEELNSNQGSLVIQSLMGHVPYGALLHLLLCICDH